MTSEKAALRDYYDSGALRLESELNRKGVPDGVCREYYENGNLKTEQTRLNGIPHGSFRQWREDGVLLGESSLSHGTGVLREWYPNGQPKLELGFVDGVSHGIDKLNDMNGKCCMTSFYHRDKRVSEKKYLELSSSAKSGPLTETHRDSWQGSIKQSRIEMVEVISRDIIACGSGITKGGRAILASGI